MRTFIYKVAIYCIPTFALLMLTLFLFNKYQVQKLFILNPLINVFAIGDSQIVYGLDPEEMRGLASFSTTAEPMDISVLKLKEAIRKNKGIKCVIVGVPTHVLFKDDKTIVEQSIRFWPLLLGIESFHEIRCKNHSLSNWINWISISSKTLISILNINYQDLMKGLTSRNISLFEERGQNKYLVDYPIMRHYQLEDNKQYSKKVFTIVQECKKICDDNRIKIIFIRPPCHKIYRDRVPQEKMLKYLQLTKMLKNNNCIYLDYWELELEDKDYLDSNHLNKTGAKKFTQKLKLDIERLSF